MFNLGSVVITTRDTPASENIEYNGRRYLTDYHSNRASHDPRPMNTVARRLWEKYYGCLAGFTSYHDYFFNRQFSVDDSSNGYHGNIALTQKFKQLRGQLVSMQPAVGHCRIEVCCVQ